MIKLISVELRRAVDEFRFYWINVLSEIAVTYLFFIGLFYSYYINADSPSYFLIIALLIWLYAQEAMNQMCHYVLEEKYFGTIEQLFMSNYRPTAILGARVISSFLITTITAVPLGFLMYMSAGFPQSEFHAIILLPFFLTLIPLYGFGYMLAGLTLRYSNVSSVGSVLTYVLLIFSGIFPIQIPMEKLAYLMNPIGFGIKTIESFSLEGFSWFPIGVLALQGLIFMGTGLLAFNLSVYFARKSGVIKKY